MTKEKHGTSELSVEEILESIRHVIRGHTLKPSRSQDLQSTDMNDGDDILELTNEHSVDNKRSPSFEYYNPKTTNVEKIDSLISENIKLETSEILQNFASHSEHCNSSPPKDKPNKTIEEFVVEMLKPELSKWLNSNLPTIVRDLVEKEISKLNPKG
ncbi:MAG: DUF2497 domain-containing protein [Pseudomonadota bacterium]